MLYYNREFYFLQEIREKIEFYPKTVTRREDINNRVTKLRSNCLELLVAQLKLPT